MEKERCGEVASKVWGESDLNPELRANSYTRSKPPKPRERDVAPRTFVRPSLRLFLQSHIPHKWGWRAFDSAFRHTT
jgi:hypothetical protein